MEKPIAERGAFVLENKEFLEKEFYRLIFENSMDAILLTQPDGTICRANPAACRMFDRTEEELISAGRDGLVDVNDPRLRDALKEREEKGCAFSELSFIRKDGTHFPGQVSANVFSDSQGQSWSALIIRDATATKETQEALVQMHKDAEDRAIRDDLTGALNRRGFMEKLQKEWNRMQRVGGQMAVMMIDVDHFKFINDRYGHLVGDLILVELAQRLATTVRPYDEIGRYGGDEFVLMLPDIGKTEALQAAHRIRETFRDQPIRAGRHTIPITVSIGVVAATDQDPVSLSEVLSTADDYMYRAKEKRDYVYMEEYQKGL
jgi:diguanylate cyclase (GGDEF)-like protein/PAS domain S-box-containing protein